MTNRTHNLGAVEGSVEALELVGGPCGPVSFGDLISTFRMCDEMSQAEFAQVLGVSDSYLSDIENGEKIVSPETAAAWAASIGYPAPVFVARAFQDQLDRAGVEMRVKMESMEAEDERGPTQIPNEAEDEAVLCLWGYHEVELVGAVVGAVVLWWTDPRP